MISPSEIDGIISVYLKHGWLLRRILISAGSKSRLRLPESVPANTAVVDSDIDALWFSRPPKPGGVPWEIRHLSTVPFALLFTIDEFDADYEDALASAEDVLRTHIANRKEA